MRAVLLVTGTTVTTPRPSRVAVELAWSLLTMIAGRRLFASLPRDGSRSMIRISPRRIGDPVADRVVPQLVLACGFPLLPRCGVVALEVRMTEQAHGVMQGRGAGRETCRFHVFVENRDVLGR